MTFRRQLHHCEKCHGSIWSWSGNIRWCEKCRPACSREADRQAKRKWARKNRRLNDRP